LYLAGNILTKATDPEAWLARALTLNKGLLLSQAVPNSVGGLLQLACLL
jgi:hypothetical protein